MSRFLARRNTTRRHLRSLSSLGTIALGSCLVLAACSNAGSTSSSGSTSGGKVQQVSAGPGNTDGVTSTQISIGGLASATGPLADQFSPIWGAVQAYLDGVNANGGVNGRKIVYTAKLDDGLLPSNDVAQARALVDQDHVFAVVGVATPSFAGGKFLAQNDVPSFGWNINPEFSSGPSLFGLPGGSYTDYTNPGPAIPWLLKKVGISKFATIAYAVTQSSQCSQGQVNAVNKFKVANVVLQDTSLPYGATDLSGDMSKLRSSGAQFIGSCLDTGGNVTLSKSLQESGLSNSIKQYWPNGYDSTALAANAKYMEGVYFDTDGVVPFNMGYTKGMDAYLTAMSSHHLPVSAVTLAGWMSADLFVKGLKMIGNDVTRSKLVNAINSLTNYTAQNINPGINWTTAHGPSNAPNCDAFVQVQNGKFVPVFGTKTDPMLCWSSNNTDTLNTIPFPGNESSFFNG